MTAAAHGAASGRSTERFEMLDLLRGIAAVAVLIYHSVNFLGFQLLPDAYVAVDLFFMLSGFVIAHNYDPKIAAGMSLREFMRQRGIRLFPCYWLGLAVGLVLGGARMIHTEGYVDAIGLAAAAACNLLMLPALVPLYSNTSMFPFNGVSWSLLYELIANAVYWLTYRLLNRVNLLVLVGVAAPAFVVAALHVGAVDVGMRSGEAPAALCRVAFSFFAGVAIRRHVHGALRIRLAAPGICAAVAALLLTFCSSYLFGQGPLLLNQFIAVFIVFPLLLVTLSNTVPGPRLAALCRFAGNVSYPVYILQGPALLLIAAVPQVFFHRKAASWVPAIGIVEVGLVVAFAWWIDAYFDSPVRRLLKTHFLPRRQLSVDAP